jgi:type II secretory pathway component GspD/PulD (secretin)
MRILTGRSWMVFACLAAFMPASIAVTPKAGHQTKSRTSVAGGTIEIEGPVGKNVPSLVCKQADVQAVLRDLFGAGKLSYSVTPDVKGTITVNLRNVPLDDALKHILRPFDATFRVERGVYVISQDKGPVVQAITPASAQGPETHLHLKVLLTDPYNRHFCIEIGISMGKPFKVVTTNGDVTTTISGVVTPTADGKYSLPLYVSEWESEQSNIRGGGDYTLELGKPAGGGFISSFAYGRSITLTAEP